MKFVVFGAAGATGLLLTQQGLDRGHRVTAVTRRPHQYPLRHPRLTVALADATDPSAVSRVVDGADAVTSVLGTPYSRGPITLYSRSARAIITAMTELGVKRLVVTSSAASTPWRDPSWTWVERAVVRRVLNALGSTLYADMRRMERIVGGSALDWTIMRPLGLSNMEAPTEFAIATDHISGKQTARRDLARAILNEIDGQAAAHHRQAIAVATVNKSVSLPVTIWREGIRPQIEHAWDRIQPRRTGGAR